MARKAKDSSCQVEHWWEEKNQRGHKRKSDGKWQRRSDVEVRLAIRHMIEVHLLGKKPGAEDLRNIGKNVFKRLGLSGLLTVRFRCSTIRVIRYAYPEFFDLSRPDHLHEWDFKQQGMWKDSRGDEFTSLAIRHMIEVHLLGRVAKAEDLLKLTAKNLQSPPLRLGGLLSKKFNSSPAAALRHAYPEFFDYSRSDHVHEWNFVAQGGREQKAWRGYARLAVRHTIEKHLLQRSAQPDDLCKITQEVLNRIGLGGLLKRFDGSPAAALRHAYPEFFDYSLPDHLHEWDISHQRNMWRGNTGRKLACAATRHMIEVHLLGRATTPQDLRKIKGADILKLGLNGAIRHFGDSPGILLRHAYPEFAEAIGGRIKGTADFVDVLKKESSVKARRLLRDLMSHFGDDLVDVADILAVVYTGRLEAKTAMEILQDPTMRPWIVPFTGKGHGPGKPPIGDDFPFYLLEKDQNGVIAGIIRRRLTEWRRRVLGARPSAKAREKFLRELRTLQEKFRTSGGKEVAPAAE